MSDASLPSAGDPVFDLHLGGKLGAAATVVANGRSDDPHQVDTARAEAVVRV